MDHALAGPQHDNPLSNWTPSDGLHKLPRFGRHCPVVMGTVNAFSFGTRCDSCGPTHHCRANGHNSGSECQNPRQLDRQTRQSMLNANGGMFAQRAPGACPVCYLCIKYLISSPKFIPTLGSPPSRPH